MTAALRNLLLAMAIAACSLSVQSSHAARGMSAACADDGVEKFAIEEHEDNRVSVCRADGVGDCLYTQAYGKTFVDSRLHLNTDKRRDYVIKDFTGAYGLNDVVHFMLFAQCRDGKYVQVADDFFTSLKAGAIDASTGWLNLHVTRDCYSEKIGDTQARSYTISFDPKHSEYGPPNANPALTHYCSDAELALPASAASSPLSK
ncbi:hypothetical protein [Burkholderia sp. SRS-W-2-2016]|uniref:hypothetical protein n=1 Tax=Burkholderia sp. SRS-W-2-2016 TaxID=1926878 RepID=UPI00117F0002|nr:hypothetical protein [Burkholderia sp. SRS-W-2-2016]